MGGANDFDAVHWDPEPTPNPSQEGNWHEADECLLPFWEGSGVGRFMVRIIGLVNGILHGCPRPAGRYVFSVGSARASRAVFGALAEHTVRSAGAEYLFSVVAARATERGLQSAGLLVSEGDFGILRARLCAAHVPAG